MKTELQVYVSREPEPAQKEPKTELNQKIQLHLPRVRVPTHTAWHRETERMEVRIQGFCDSLTEISSQAATTPVL